MEKINNMSPYEQEQYSAISTWENREPNLVTQMFNKVMTPLSTVMSMIVPTKSIDGALMFANYAAELVAFRKDIIKGADVKCLEELRCKNLILSDKLADEVRAYAVAAAGIEGGISGSAGWLGFAIDVPTLITMAFRVIHKTAMCYGYTCDDDKGYLTVLNILKTASAGTMQEKTASITMLHGLTNSLTKGFWEKLFSKTTSFDLIANTVKTAAKQLGINLSKRKVAQMAPLVGAGVGAAVNSSFIYDIAVSAKYVFQRQWLVGNGKIIENNCSDEYMQTAV